MQLRWSPTSPFVRKVTVTLLETGLDDRVEQVPTNVHVPETTIGEDNPLNKIPALRLDGGETLYDSRVICEYLDTLHDGIPLFPPQGGLRWTALRRQALGDGLCDAAVLAMLEGRRPEEQRSQVWIDKQMLKVRQSLVVLEEEIGEYGGGVTIGHISVAVALCYLDFRFADLGWKESHPKLANWLEYFSLRRSMQETIPKDPA